MASIHYTSELAAKALGLAPGGAPHAGSACFCAMCQRQIQKGDLAGPLDLPKTYQDFEKLGSSGVICGFCIATTSQSVMRALQRAVITEQAIYPMNTDDARAWFWTTPPAAPYAVVINHSTMAAFHYFWRTPVTLDSRVVSMNVDNVVYEVSRDRIERAKRCAALLVQAAAEGPKKEAFKSPFFMLARDPSKSAKKNSGHLLASSRAIAKKTPELTAALDFLDTLTPGELIALSPFLKQNPSTPTQPTPLTLEDSK